MFVSGQVTASDPLGERRTHHFQTQLWWLPSATTAVSYLGLQVFRVDRCFQELVRRLAAGVSPATPVSETCTRGAPRCHRYAGIDPQDFRELSCAFMSWYGLWISSVIPLKLAADQWFSNCLGANGGGTFTLSRVSGLHLLLNVSARSSCQHSVSNKRLIPALTQGQGHRWASWEPGDGRGNARRQVPMHHLKE